MAKRGHDSVGRQVRGYLAAMPLATRRVLKRIRSDIRAVAPRATEVFSCGIPGFRLDGRALVWYAGFKTGRHRRS